ncbi:hypothetical protein JCM6882_005546 [Rhodosporidiobolus microsporus]
MKTSIFALTTLLQITGSLAFPWMAAPGAEQATHDYLKERGLLSDLGNTVVAGGETLITGVEGGLGQLVDGLSAALATGVRESDRRPDADHPFQAPGPTDQRGPCPGLNTLANHGYLPRSGIVTGSEIIEAVGEGFNMAADLAGLLVLIAVAFGGNLETATFSIGGEDDRTYSATGIGSKAAGRQFGLDGHSRCEGDASATRADFFMNGGDNHNGQPERFRRFMELAKKNGGQFNVAAANELYAQNADISLENNPKLYFQAYTIIVILGEYPFIPNFFTNGTYGAGGVSNLESISSLMGYQINEDGSICYVPERFPDNWYRRATPYGFVNGLVPGLPGTLAANPKLLPNPLSAIFASGQVSQIGCALYQGITSGIPASILGSTVESVSQLTKSLQQKLLPGLPNLFSCDVDQNSLQEDGVGGGQYFDASMQASGGNGQQRYGEICDAA